MRGRSMGKYGRAIMLAILTGCLVASGLWIKGCDKESGPDLAGEIKLSSQLYGSDGYYIFGYSYKDSKMYRYPFLDEPFPDIINEGFLVMNGDNLKSLPGFNTPGQVNGFALAGEFDSMQEARTYYETYSRVKDDLDFLSVSDTVKLFQVWIQQTEAGNFVKILVKEIREFETEGGRMNNEVTLEFTYQPDGSPSFGS